MAEINHANGGIVIEEHKIERIIVEESEPETKLLPIEREDSSRLWTVALAVLAVAAIGAGFWLWTKKEATAKPIESIAVMPFVFEGENSENEYLSNGITESLINNISQLPKLTVKARNSVFHYKGKGIEPQKIGAELNVQAVFKFA